jgi:glycosyltransferase involved in cell wall biosynthesis
LALRRKTRAVFCDSTAYDRPRKFTKDVAKRLFFSLCHGFFGYGQRSREYLQSLGVNPRYIYHRCQAAALALDYNPELAARKRVAAQKTTGAKMTFIYVGRISPEKGLDTLLRALALATEADRDITLKMIGAGPIADQLKQQADELGISAHVHWAGSMNVEQLSDAYAHATAMILPSTSEPWGLVVNEALSYGCPVIVSHRCGCVPELVIDGVTGYSFTAGDEQQLAGLMLKFRQSFQDSQTSGTTCINHMAQFTPQRAAQQIIEGCSVLAAENR